MSVASQNHKSVYDVATPPSSPSLLSGLLTGQTIPSFLAQVGAFIGSAGAGPIRFGTKVVVIRHTDVVEMLARDLDFQIAPINQKRIEEVNGPFVLGMDRGAKLIHERGALYQALSQVNFAPISANVASEARARVDAAGDKIDVVADFARPVATTTAQALFGISGPDQPLFMDVARAVFGHVFLNLSDDAIIRERALRASILMREWFDAEIHRRKKASDLGNDMMGALLRGGQLDDDGIRRTLGGMLVGSIDTTATAVAKIITVVSGDKKLASKMAADVDNPKLVYGWCLEALRQWPHNPILFRKAAGDTTLSGTQIKKGDDVIAWTQAAMLDKSAFPSPSQLRPDRPISTYLHFGGELHACAGRAVNSFQIPILVGALIKRGIKSVGSIRWAGPFPDHLPLQFDR